MISVDDFKKIELKAGKVLTAERVEGSEKLVKLSVDLGPSTDSTGSPHASSGQARDIRQILAGIAAAYEPEALVGKQIIVVANLEPRIFTLRYDSGQVILESQGMLLAAEGEGGPVLLMPDKDVTPGAKVR